MQRTLHSVMVQYFLYMICNEQSDEKYPFLIGLEKLFSRKTLREAMSGNAQELNEIGYFLNLSLNLNLFAQHFSVMDIKFVLKRIAQDRASSEYTFLQNSCIAVHSILQSAQFIILSNLLNVQGIMIHRAFSHYLFLNTTRFTLV